MSVVPTQSLNGAEKNPPETLHPLLSSASCRKYCRYAFEPSGVAHGAAKTPSERTPHVILSYFLLVSIETPQFPTSKYESDLLPAA